MFFNVGTGEMLVILVLALIVLGPEKLPEAARKAGHYLAEFRRMSSGFQQELRDAIDVKPAAPGADTPEARANNGTGSFSLPMATTAASTTPDLPPPQQPAASAPIEVDGPSGSFS